MFQKNSVLTIARITSGCLLMIGLLSGFTHTDFGCKKKEDNLQIQLRYAEKYGNIQRAENLKRAILNVRTYCGQSDYADDPTLKLDDALYKQNLHEKISKQKDKIASAEKELKQAEQTGKQSKIRDKTEKLQKRQEKLELYLNELNSL